MTDGTATRRPRPKIPSGIEGFDFIARGGLPEGRSTLVSGTSGSGKTLFGMEFLAAGVRDFDEPGVFVTFEDDPDEIRANVGGLPWPVEEYEADGKWLFVDATLAQREEFQEVGDYDFQGIIARIRHAVDRIAAKRLVIDSVSTVFSQYQDSQTVRRELRRLANSLRGLGVTTLLTAERVHDYGPLARHGVEEFVADNVVVLRNALEDERRRRTVEVLKFRGTGHEEGEFPFTIQDEEGIIVIPLSAMRLEMPSSPTRVSSGSSELDEMCRGGYFRDSVVLVSGATGTGKTLMVAEFANAGAQDGHSTLVTAFEESRDQLIRGALGWGVPFEQLERDQLLHLDANYPEARSLEDHLLRIKRLVDEFQPDRVALDSLSALERAASPRSFREFVIGLVSFLKQRQITGLLTATSPVLLGGQSVTETHISTITDAIVLLRYVEIAGALHRGITVLKMRGSGHDKQIREFIIDDEGMHVGQPFGNLGGILAGNPVPLEDRQLDPFRHMFRRSAASEDVDEEE